MEWCSWALFLRRRSRPFDGQITDDPVTVQARRIVSSGILVPGLRRADEETRILTLRHAGADAGVVGGRHSCERKGLRRSSEHEPDGHDQHQDGQYARLGAQGFYWTASESDPVSAWLYNFGQGGLSLNRHEPTVTKRTLPPPSVDGLGPQHRFQVEHSCQRTGDSALLVTLMVTLNPPSEVTSVRQAGGRVETGPSSRSTLAEQR